MSPQQSERVLAGDGELAYVAQGSGDTVVFVHGSVSDFRSWQYQLDAFSERYRAVTYSRRYHWPNPQPDENVAYVFDQHVTDLVACIETLASQPVHLVGSSYGAMTALSVAIERPDLVRSLVLGEPPLLMWLAALPDGAPLLAAFMSDAFGLARLAFAQGDSETGVRTFIDGVIGHGAFDRLPPLARGMMLDNAAELRVETATPPALYFSSITSDDVRSLRVPVLLVEGARSPRMFGLITDELALALPTVRRLMVPNTSHGMHSQNPNDYNEAVMTFQSEW